MKRSKHSLSHYRLTTLNFGQLFPIACEEVLPGDSFRWQASCLMRVSPLAAPVMHPVDVSLHYWFVPDRILWTNFEEFMSGKFGTTVTVPVLTIGSADTAAKLMAQSLGVGAEIPSGSRVINALPFRAYNKIYNEFYRDELLTTALNERTGDTGDLPGDYAIRLCQWEKDYFTTCRPNPQQGAITESVPLNFTGGQAPVKGIGKKTGTSPLTNQTNMRETGGTTTTYAQSALLSGGAGTDSEWQGRTVGTNPNQFPDIYADLTGVQTSGAMDINQWRASMAMQKIREHRNRFGARYVDYLRFLGINPGDSRLQRPEYLGGGRQTIAFSEVLATAAVPSGSVLGELGGHGIASVRARSWKRFFPEHGYVLGFMFVRPRAMYVNTVPRHFLRREYNDFWQKELEMMGEQEVTNFEVYGEAGTPAGVFGYIPRFDEYRHARSYVSGEFRTSVADYWHLGRIFSSQPVLNNAFTECLPSERIFLDTNTDNFQAMVMNRVVARRLVSKRARS